MKIGIDLGTTNTKAIALSKDGEVLCELSNATVVNTVPTGGEMDPASLAQGFLSLLSDVITKAGNLTDERLEAALAECKGATCQEAIDTVLGKVKEFVGDAAQSDDITMLALKRLS